jgi:hypothetical protein
LPHSSPEAIFEEDEEEEVLTPDFGQENPM